MSSPRGRRATVVGGSIGGLMTALALDQAGFRPTVLERSRAGLTGYGQGIRVQPAIHDFFTDLLHSDFRATSTVLRERRFLDGTGRIVLSHDEPGFTSHWNALYGALRQAYRGPYRLDAQVVGVSQSDNQATVRLTDGQAIDADLVVFADGVDSIGRRELSPESSPDYAGYVAWRGTAPTTTLAPHLRAPLENGLNIQILERSHVHMYPVAGNGGAEQLFNFVWYRNVAAHELDDLMTDIAGRRRTFSMPAGLLRRQCIDEAFDVARRDLAPQIAAVITASTPSVQVIYDLMSSRMAFGRIALLGDAAFVARPHLGAGTAKAAENALALRAALDVDDIPAALQRWEATQLELGRDLVERSRRLGVLYQAEGTYPGDLALDALFSGSNLLQRARPGDRRAG